MSGIGLAEQKYRFRPLGNRRYRAAGGPEAGEVVKRASYDDPVAFSDAHQGAVEPEGLGLSEALLQGQAAIQQTGQAHRNRWGLGSAERWQLDQSTGLIRWTFADHVAEAPVQILGSHSPEGASWLWAWGNTSLPTSLCAASQAVREWGSAHGHAALTSARLDGISEEQAGELACIAFRVLRGTGFYAAPAGRARLFLVFEAVSITGANGEQQTFEIKIS